MINYVPLNLIACPQKKYQRLNKFPLHTCNKCPTEILLK